MKGVCLALLAQVTRRNLYHAALLWFLYQILENLHNSKDTMGAAGYCFAEPGFVERLYLRQSLESDDQEVHFRFSNLKIAVEIRIHDSFQNVLHDLHHQVLVNLLKRLAVLFDQSYKVTQRVPLFVQDSLQRFFGLCYPRGLTFQLCHLAIQNSVFIL